MGWIKDIYLTVFVLFFRIGQNSWSFQSNAAKGVAGVSWFQFMLLIGFTAWLYYATGSKLLLRVPPAAFYILFGIVCLVNYYALVTRGYGTKFESEFQTFGSRRRSLLIASGIGAITLSMGFAFFSAFYAHAYGLPAN
jgi:hypothetical protein